MSPLVYGAITPISGIVASSAQEANSKVVSIKLAGDGFPFILIRIEDSWCFLGNIPILYPREIGQRVPIWNVDGVLWIPSRDDWQWIL